MRSRNVHQLVAVMVGLCLAGASWAGQSIIYVDDDGARVISPTITFTLQRATESQ